MEIGHRLRELKPDGTVDCDECGLPMFPYARTATEVRLECANHHHGLARAPVGPAKWRMVDNWIAKRGAQLHVQHERWGTDDERGRNKDDI